jgi:hypothetical protein
MRWLSLGLLWLLLAMSPVYGQDGLPVDLRVPRGEVTTTASDGSLDLPAQVEEHLALVRDPERFHAGNATALMSGTFDLLDRLDPAHVDYAAIDRDPHGLIRRLLDLTLAIDDRMAEFHARGLYDHTMADGKRKAMRGIRFLREQVLLRTQAQAPERLYEHGVPPLAAPDFMSEFHWTVNPAYAGVTMTADALPRTFFMMNVGTSTVSAAIARSGTSDSMFSHYSVGYVSDREHVVEKVLYPAGTVFTIEAMIGEGVTAKPIRAHFSDSAREVIFFLRDPAQQAAVDAAADTFFARVIKAQNKGKNLGYDFSMGQAGAAQALTGEAPAEAQPEKRGLISASRYFCSGVADAIGDEAGVELFSHRSLLEQGTNSSKLFASWGMDPSRRVPVPGDGDASAAYVRVAEGTYLGKLLDSHLMHAVLQSMFEWMDTDGYNLRVPGWFKPVSWVMGTFNSDSFNIGFVPKGVNTPVLRSFMSLKKAATKYQERLRADNEAFRAEHGRDMTPREMRAHLREVRDDVKVRRWFRK